MSDDAHARNAILFIGDGMGVPTVTAPESVNPGERNRHPCWFVGADFFWPMLVAWRELIGRSGAAGLRIGATVAVRQIGDFAEILELPRSGAF